jgi:hypothetical protein
MKLLYKAKELLPHAHENILIWFAETRRIGGLSASRLDETDYPLLYCAG